MAQVLFIQRSDGWSWRLTTADGTGVLARAAEVSPDEESCRRAAAAVLGGGDCAVVVHGESDQWWWELGGDDGAPAARSEVFSTADACAIALRRFQFATLLL